MAKIICTVTNDLTFDQRMIRICSSLAQDGHEVLLVGRRLSRSLPLRAQSFRQKRLTCWFTTGKLFYLEFNIRLFFFLLLQKTDVHNAIDLDTILPCLAASWVKRSRLFYDAHEYFTETPEVIRRPSIQKVWNGIAKLAIPRVDRAYTVGPALADIMGGRYGVEFVTIRNVPFARKTDKSADLSTNQPKVILYQGALNEGRGLESAIAAMQYVTDAELWLAGEGDLSALLREQTNELDLTDRVKFLGFIRPENLVELTPKATLGLNLLENKGLSYYYSLANKAFDYIQATVPAIHMDFPEYQSLANNYGGVVLVKKLDIPYLAEQLSSLVHDEDRLGRLRAECREAAPHLTWEKEREKLLRLYS